MDLSQIRELLSVVAESDVEELTVEEEGLKVTVRKSAPTITMQSAAAGGYPMPAAPAYPPQGYVPQNAQSQPAAPPPVPQQGAGHQARAASPAASQASQPGPAPAAGSTAESAAAGAEEEAAPEESGTTVPAPIVGTFYRCPSPDDEPYVEVGDTVKEGDVLCIIEAMKLMNEIECETAGTIKEILAEDAEPVEYEQPLFVIEES